MFVLGVAASWLVVSLCSMCAFISVSVGGVGVALWHGLLFLFYFEGDTALLKLERCAPSWNWWPFAFDRPLPGSAALVVPAWITWVLLAVAAFTVFRCRKMTLPGHCRCGYNLTGNRSERCPECGQSM